MLTKAEVIGLLQCIPGGHIWFSGIEGEGEYKEWHYNGQLWEHSFWKNGKYDGEYKHWNDNGQLTAHSFFKNGILKGEYKWWNGNGQLYHHGFWKNGKEVITKNVKKGFILVDGKYYED